MKILRSVSRLTLCIGDWALFYVNLVIVVIHCRPVVKLIRLLLFYQFHTFQQRHAARAVNVVLCVQDVMVTVIDATTVKFVIHPQPGATATDIVLTAATSLQDATTVSNLQIYLSTYQSIYLNICLGTGYKSINMCKCTE